MSNKRDREIQKERVLNSILIESYDIKKYCDDRMQIWNQETILEKIKKNCYQQNRIEYNLIYYRDFNPPMNRYKSAVNTGDLKYVDSENIKESITRLHNLNFSKVVSTVDYEKKIISLIIELITEENASLILNANDTKINFEKYLKSLHRFIQENEKLKSNLIVQLKYFKTRVSSLKVYMITLENSNIILKKS